MVGQTVKHLPTMWETWVQSLGQEDLLDFSILAWKIPWTEEPCRLQSVGSQRVGCDPASSVSFLFFFKNLHSKNKTQSFYHILQGHVRSEMRPPGRFLPLFLLLALSQPHSPFLSVNCSPIFTLLILYQRQQTFSALGQSKYFRLCGADSLCRSFSSLLLLWERSLR